MNKLSIHASYQPKQAIIIYQNKQDQAYYLESHSVYAVDNKSVLSEGKPLSKSTIENIASYYYSDAKQVFKHKRLLPKNLLYADLKIGNNLMVWHCKASLKNLYFSNQLSIDSGTASVPNLLFVAQNENLSVFALSTEQVSLTSKLYIAPFHNVYPDGRVCLGNAKVGKVTGVEYEEAIEEWEKSFFCSEFTALHSAGSPTHSNVNLLWRKLIESKEPFPLKELKEHSLTSVENLINKL